MSLEVKTFCPLGAKCEEARDGAIHRCSWYACVRGTNQNTGEEIDEWRCAMNWMPMLMIENSAMQRSTGAAVESFRNEMVKANESAQQVLLAAVNTPSQRLIKDINA
jgi:predicted outer membrane protein